MPAVALSRLPSCLLLFLLVLSACASAPRGPADTAPSATEDSEDDPIGEILAPEVEAEAVVEEDVPEGPKIHPDFVRAAAAPENQREAPNWKASYGDLDEVPMGEVFGGGPIDDLDFEGLALAVERSISYLEGLPAGSETRIGDRRLAATSLIGSLQGLLELLRRPGGGLSLTELEEGFIAYRSTPEGKLTKATGYYEPMYQASLEQSPDFAWPIHPVPDNLRKPDDTREQIVFENSLEGRSEPIAWMANPVDLSILHIQGSAMLEFPDGTIGRVNYKTSNGHKFYPIGRALLDVIPRSEMSIQAIRNYLLDHPERWREILSRDASYVFMRPMADGPMGTIQQPVTGERSIAVDQTKVPLGALCFISVPELRAKSAESSGASIHRLVMAQDTGGAIKGPGRFDYFRGTGSEAETKAGPMNEEAELFVLLPR